MTWRSVTWTITLVAVGFAAYAFRDLARTLERAGAFDTGGHE